MSSILSLDLLDQPAQVLVVVAAAATVVAKLLADYFEGKKARDRLFEAERNAFQHTQDADGDGDGDVVVGKRETSGQSENSRDDPVSASRLFNLYSKQIEKYQTDTQARASWSFVFAVFAMLGGLGFVVWGGAHLLISPGWEHVAGATAIAGIGGSIGAYIAKTFLDVHRLSLSQLNHYFRQPVINAHVLTGQRLADQLTQPLARQQAYELLLQQVASLIRENSLPGSVWGSNTQTSTTTQNRDSDSVGTYANTAPK